MHSRRALRLPGVVGLSGFDAERYQLALGIARIPEQIKGFGHVKAHHLKAARQNWAVQLAQFRLPHVAQKAA